MGDEVFVFLFELVELGTGAVFLGLVVFGFGLDLEALVFEGLEFFCDLGEFFVGGDVLSFGGEFGLFDFFKLRGEFIDLFFEMQF